MYFASKIYFLLLLPVALWVVWYCFHQKHTEPTMLMSDTHAYTRAPRSWRVRLRHLPMALRTIALVLIVVALARPQVTTPRGAERDVEGIDIMMAMDVSTSMLAEDLKPNRIEAAKSVAAEFIGNRPNDNIGLTIFAGEAFTQCPMTTDHASLLNLLQSVRTDIAARGLIEDGTAVGMGLASAVGRLKDSKAKSKVVILLTDGSNNRGDISPITAAEIARSLGVRVYTIALGTNKVAPYPMMVGGTVQYVNLPAEVDTATLTKIAQTTEGHFYRAGSTAELKKIYSEIDKMEKTKLKSKSLSKKYDAYQQFLWVAVTLLLIELLLRVTTFRRIP